MTEPLGRKKRDELRRLLSALLASFARTGVADSWPFLLDPRVTSTPTADALTAAAPIMEVRLTTWPELEETGLSYHAGRRLFRLHGRKEQRFLADPIGRLVSESILELLAAEWPRIRFTLPAIIDARWNTEPGDIRADLELVRRRAMERVGFDAGFTEEQANVLRALAERELRSDED